MVSRVTLYLEVINNKTCINLLYISSYIICIKRFNEFVSHNYVKTILYHDRDHFKFQKLALWLLAEFYPSSLYMNNNEMHKLYSMYYVY